MTEEYKPIGLEFHDLVSGRQMVYVTEGQYKGWICYKHPDGQWVTLRIATQEDKERIFACLLKRPPSDEPSTWEYNATQKEKDKEKEV